MATEAKLLPRKAVRPPRADSCCGLPLLEEIKSEKATVSGCLSFTKIKARNLRSADLLDESDPFVKLELGTAARPVCTTVVWNNEKSPEWKDPRTGKWEVLRMPVTGALVGRLPELQISVIDQDNFSSNDPLGNRSLQVFELIEKEAGKRNSDYSAHLLKLFLSF